MYIISNFLIYKTKKEIPGEMAQWQSLLPNLKIWVQLLWPTQWKERYTQIIIKCEKDKEWYVY